MTIRIILGITLFRLGLRDVLPKDAVNAITAIDNKEPLITLTASSRVMLRPFFAGDRLRARQSAVDMLGIAANRLPDNFSLVVVDAYRSRVCQEERWQQRLREFEIRMPGATLQKIEDAAARFTAKPSAIGSGHQAGAAFDLTLADRSGREYDLGTAIKEVTSLTPTKSKGVTREQAYLRRLLCDAMQEVGFVNYPLEWWHFSYGDRLWAAYTGRATAIFDTIDVPDDEYT